MGQRAAAPGDEVASQAGFEPATRCLEGSRSIQLSYWDVTHLVRL